MGRTGCLVASLLLAGGQVAHAATPISRINYQGVLRDAADVPLSGVYDMKFRFFDAPMAGNEIIVDWHTSERPPGPVTVTGGLFSAMLGTVALDGSGPGTYNSLAEVFRDYNSVYLEVQVGSEILSPRTMIVSAASALNASNLGGHAPSEFLDTSTTGQVKGGPLEVDYTIAGNPALKGVGKSWSGWFTNTDYGSVAKLANGSIGVEGHGSQFGVFPPGPGGYFECDSGFRYAYVAKSGYGIETSAQILGDIGIKATGDAAGGYFLTSTPGTFAYAAYADLGLWASGSQAGGYFTDRDTGSATYAGYDDYGLQAYGRTVGGYFKSTLYSTDVALAYGDYGLWAHGNLLGAQFVDNDSNVYANMAYGGYTIEGNGTKAFVQNHPYEKDKVVVYNALEGDEAATYTRGSARLIGGEARIALDPTFAWVTNPDIGLTVQLTPVGGWSELYVATKSTKELVVRSRDSKTANVDFDYVVTGLRVGFEELSIVQEKVFESLIPNMADDRARYAKHPELRAYSALERFKGMPTPRGGPKALDLTASKALHDAVGEFDPAVDRPIGALPFDPEGRQPIHPVQPVSSRATSPSARPVVPARPEIGSIPPPSLPLVAVRAQVQVGDVLVNDLQQPGVMKLSDSAGDRGVVGVVSGDRDATFRNDAPLATSGVVLCNVDAGYGAIAANDLLVASPTPGHAMRAPAGAPVAPGALLGKALEPLDAGTGAIRILVTLR